MTSSLDLKISHRAKNAHESRFYLILNALSDDDVQWAFFREALKFLCMPELEEIVEERTCKDKCGYVLCNSLINMHRTAVISLSVTKRKIFNISNRKKFCSDWCYGAHKYISAQISPDPYWKNMANGRKSPQHFNLYPKGESGCPGEIYFEETEMAVDKPVEQVPTPVPVVVKNTSNDSPNTKYVKRIEKVQHVITALDKLIVNKKKDLTEVVQKIKTKSDNTKARKIILIDDVSHNNESPVAKKSESDVLVSARKTASMISEWITEQTRDYICLDTTDKRDDSCSDNSDDDDDSRLKNETQSYEDDAPAPVFLPTIDSANQRTIRKSLLIKRMKLVSVSIVADFGVDKTDFMDKFARFIDTCRLTPSNIFFSAKEFTWLAIFLIDLLAPKLSDRVAVNKAEVLQKYGISQSALYDTIMGGLNDLVYGVKGVAVSSQGDSEM